MGCDATGSYVHLHTHSHYSMLDGACTIDRLLELAEENEMDSLALTDHGNLFGAIEFYKKAMKRGIKPILGCELYIAPGAMSERKVGRHGRTSYHLTLLAENRTGYTNLMQLSSLGYTKGFYYKPRVDHDALAAHSEGLICLSGCLASEVNTCLTHDDYDGAKDQARFYRDLFGEENFFIEVMDHGIEEQQHNTPGLLQIADELSLPLVATNDIHYAEKGDLRSHEVLLCINTGKTINDPNRMRMTQDAFYFSSDEEMRARHADHPGAVENTRRIAERCEVEIDFDTMHLPRFDPPDGSTPVEYFRKLCWEGLEERYDPITEEQKERLKYEMGVIEEMGFTSYFLIVWDFIRFARDEGIPVGPGRGSAAGSLVAYVLRITDIDPLRYDLLFERFLNKERVSMPDIDIDFCQERRGEVIEYVREKYGEEAVCQIITFNVMKARAVIRDVGRALDIPLREVDKVAKLVPDDLGITLPEALEKEAELKELSQDPRYRELFEHALKLEGLARHAGIHAAGVVIADQPLLECVPLYMRGDDLTTQYSMGYLEEIGLLKMDFLGLRTLTVLEEAVALIEKNHGVSLDLSNLPMDDQKTFDLMSSGTSKGVFQMESSGFRELLGKLRPNRFEDMIALVALYRPGPLGSGMVDTYCNRKHGEEKTVHLHPCLEEILDETYGIILYQEQVMRIANRMADFTLNQADSLRKAMGKKKPEVMAKFKDQFIEGAVANDIDRDVAMTVWEQMEYFAGYGFNKSHSAAYAYVAYQTAYLKANWPAEFMAATMSSWMNTTDKLIDYIDEVDRLDLELVPPDVNRSDVRFDVRDGAVVYGLAAVRGVGERAAESIVEAREDEEEGGPFTDIYSLTSRIDTRLCNKGAVEALIKAGALDSIEGNRAQLLDILDTAITTGARMRADKEAGQMNLFGGLPEDSEPDPGSSLPALDELSETQLLAFEKEALGFFLSSHPLNRYEELVQRFATSTIRGLSERSAEGDVTICAMISSVKKHIDRRGNPMAFLGLEDTSGSMEATVFSRIYEDYRELLKPEAILFFQGRLDDRKEEPAILVDKVIPPEGAAETLKTNVHIELPSNFSQAEKNLDALRLLFERYRGNNPVYLRVSCPGARVTIKAGSRYRVAATEDFAKELRSLLGTTSGLTFAKA